MKDNEINEQNQKAFSSLTDNQTPSGLERAEKKQD